VLALSLQTFFTFYKLKIGSMQKLSRLIAFYILRLGTLKYANKFRFWNINLKLKCRTLTPCNVCQLERVWVYVWVEVGQREQTYFLSQLYKQVNLSQINWKSLTLNYLATNNLILIWATHSSEIKSVFRLLLRLIFNHRVGSTSKQYVICYDAWS